MARLTERRAVSITAAMAICTSTLTAVAGTRGATAAGVTGAALSVGPYAYPTAISFERSGAVALVIGTYHGTVTPVDTATGHVQDAITVGGFPDAAAITS